jgi:hypothetical protein
MSLTNCRYYPEKYPEVDSYVMVNVKQVYFIPIYKFLGAERTQYSSTLKHVGLMCTCAIDRRDGRLRQAPRI